MRNSWEKLFRLYPLVPLAVACTFGVCAARFLPLSLSASAVVIGFSLVFFVIRRWLKIAGLLLFFGAGSFIYTWRYEALSPLDLRLLVGEKETLVTVRGELLETPAVRETHYGEKIRVNSSGRVRVNEIFFEHEWHAAAGVISTSTRQEMGEGYFGGQKVEIAGVLQMPARALAPGLFDFREYLYNQRIFYVLRADSTNDWKIVFSPLRPPLQERFRRWAKVQLGRGLKQEDEALRLIWAMTLGWQSTLSGEMSEPFMKTGTMHIFAISGLHVTCIGGLFLLAARGLGRPRHQCGMIIIPLLWFYVLATGWQSSAIRSAIMSSVIIAGWALKRPAALLNSTAAAALLILLFQPEQLFQTSFQLSFAVVASMALFVPVLEELREKILAPDEFLPPELRPKWQKLLDMPIRFISVNFVVSLASWVGSLPIVAYYFNMVTPVSLLANLVAVPLSSVALAFTVLSLMIPPLGPVFNWVSWGFMKATIWSAKAFSIFPLGYFYVPKPNWEFFVFFFGFVGAIMTGSLWKAEKRRRVIPLISLLFVVWIGSMFVNRSAAEITVFSAAGTPVYADFAGRANDLLIDCSDERDANFVIKRALHAQGVGSVRNLVLSHGDINHAQGFFELAPEFSPARIFTTPARARSPTYKRVVKTLEGLPGKWQRVSRGELLGNWQVLHPPPDRSFARADDNSIVLRTEIEGWRILFLGDLGSKGQDELLKSESDLRADVVISGMPEQGEPLKSELLERLKPKVIVLGTTRYPVSGRGSIALRERLSAENSIVLSTGDEGSVVARFKKGVCSVRTVKGEQVALREE